MEVAVKQKIHPFHGGQGDGVLHFDEVVFRRQAHLQVVVNLALGKA
jgi:hypothetical protein